MNYEPNTRRWQIGDIVIHDADAKKSAMLMCVVGYDPKTGECKTRYCSPEYLPGMWKSFKNDIKYLHNPAQFGLIALKKGQNNGTFSAGVQARLVDRSDD